MQDFFKFKRGTGEYLQKREILFLEIVKRASRKCFEKTAHKMAVLGYCIRNAGGCTIYDDGSVYSGSLYPCTRNAQNKAEIEGDRLLWEIGEEINEKLKNGTFETLEG